MSAAASLMRVFRAWPVPDRRRPWRLAADNFYNLLARGIPWWQGKMQGISSIVFFENPSRKHLQIQSFVRDFPTQPSREFIRPSREFIPPFRPE